MIDIREKLKKSYVQVGILFFTLALYLVTNSLFGSAKNPYNFLPPLFGALIVVEFFIFVGFEVKDGAKKYGWKHEIVDTIIALVIAVGVWYGFSLVLNTSTPISGVVSCSMLPNLQRGDFVIVQGAPVASYEISMTQNELDSLNSPATIFYDDKNISIPGSIFPFCISSSDNEPCQFFIKNPQSLVEKKGVFTYHYQQCTINYSNGSSATEPCLKSVTFKGKEYLANFSNDIIVYKPPSGDVFSKIGDIVHRTMFKINVDGKYYYLTRGDNNPLLDMQVYDYGTGAVNHPIPQENLRGKVIARIPLLGYFKLFLSGYFSEDPQCKMQLGFDHL